MREWPDPSRWLVTSAAIAESEAEVGRQSLAVPLSRQRSEQPGGESRVDHCREKERQEKEKVPSHQRGVAALVTVTAVVDIVDVVAVESDRVSSLQQLLAVVAAAVVVVDLVVVQRQEEQ